MMIERKPQLTPQQQKEARRRRAEGATLKELAKRLQCGPEHDFTAGGVKEMDELSVWGMIRVKQITTATALAVVLTALLSTTGPADSHEARRISPACTMPSTYASRWVCDSPYMTSMFDMVQDQARQNMNQISLAG